MKKLIVLAALAAAVGGPILQASQVDLGIAVSDGRLRSFYLAVGDHYRVAPRAVLDFRTRHRLLDEELPVVFFLAARAHIGPQAVVDLRLGKRSWLDVAIHLGLSTEIFFVPVGLERIGPPYGNAYGYYRKHGPAGDWRKIVLTDREVVDLVNLRFMSEYHGVPPGQIMSLRARHKSFVGLHDELGRSRAKEQGPQEKGPKGGKPAKGKKK